MAIDASIYGQIKQPQIANPLAQLAQAQQLQGITQQNRLAQLQMQEYERKRAQDEQTRNVVRGFGTDTNANYQALIGSGDLQGAQAYQKSVLDQNKSAGEADAQKLKVARERIDLMGQGLGFVMQNPTLENAQSAISRLVSAGVLDQTQGQEAWAKFQANPTPDGIRAFAQQGYQASLSSKDQLMKFETRNTGATTDTLAQNPVTGQVQVANSVNNTQSPDAVLSAQTSRANNVASVAATIRGQNLTDSRARESNALQREASRNQIVDTENGPVLVDKGTGQARSVSLNGQQLPGKPSEAQKKELLSINQQRSILGGALKAVEATPSAFSFGRGAAGNLPGGESIAGRMETAEQTQARAYVFNNVSRVINERAGAAQSAQELQRLNGFLPAATDNATQIANKLRGFQTYLNDLESGTRVSPGARSSDASSAQAPGAVRLSDDDLLKKYGGR